MKLQERCGLQGAMVHWVGRRGAGVRGFPDLMDIVRYSGYPSMVILHMGANDIGTMSNRDISSSLLSMRDAISRTFPGCEVVISELVYRKRYRGCSDASAMDRCRRRVNTDLHKHAAGWVILHRNLDGTEGQLLVDGVHLTHIGNCLFIWNIFKYFRTIY